MEEWYSRNYMIKFNEELFDEPFEEILNDNIEEIYSDKYSRPSKSLVDIDLYKKNILLRDRTSDSSTFEKWFKLVNPYEKVLKLSKHNKEKETVYLKLLEILIFIGYKKNPDDFWYIINNNSPIYENCCEFLGNKNLVEIKDMISVSKLKEKSFFENKYSLVFGDIFIDMSFDYNNQEQLYFKYFLYSIINAMKLGSENGTFICRIYDTITKPTVQLITILKFVFKEIMLIKPRMSYCVSSEKYIICSGFKKNEKILDKLITIYEGINGNFCRDLFVLFPDNFKEKYEDISERLNIFNNRLIENEINLLENIVNSSNQSYIYTKLLENYQQKISSEFVEVFCISKRDSDNTINDCRHFTKNLNSINRCEKCFKYWT